MNKIIGGLDVYKNIYVDLKEKDFVDKSKPDIKIIQGSLKIVLYLSAKIGENIFDVVRSIKT